MHENLPIYKKAMEVCVQLEQAVRNFPRYHKYVIGAELRREAYSIIRKIILASLSKHRKPFLEELRHECESLKSTLWIAKEVKAFSSLAQFENILKLHLNLCKQTQGWLSSQKEK